MGIIQNRRPITMYRSIIFLSRTLQSILHVGKSTRRFTVFYLFSERCRKVPFVVLGRIFILISTKYFPFSSQLSNSIRTSIISERIIVTYLQNQCQVRSFMYDILLAGTLQLIFSRVPPAISNFPPPSIFHIIHIFAFVSHIHNQPNEKGKPVYIFTKSRLGSHKL